MNILIADNEKDMLKILKVYFEKAGFKVFLAADGEQALKIFYSQKIDLAILDWMMPKVDGIKVCQEIKDRSDLRVLILTAKTQNEDELRALTSGADEYLRKPFDPRVLIIRAKKLLLEDKAVYVKDLKIDFQANKIFKQGYDLQVTKKEFGLMECLWKNKGKILSRKKLLDIVWGFDYYGGDRTVDTHIKRLRKKIGEGLIKTYRGLGYSLEENSE